MDLPPIRVRLHPVENGRVSDEPHEGRPGGSPDPRGEILLPVLFLEIVEFDLDQFMPLQPLVDSADQPLREPLPADLNDRLQPVGKAS